MELQFITANDVDIPLERPFPIEKGVALLDRANQQLLAEGLKSEIDYALVENDTRYFQSTVRLPNDTLNLLEEIEDVLKESDGQPEAIEQLRQMIDDAFPKELQKKYTRFGFGKKKEKNSTPVEQEKKEKPLAETHTPKESKEQEELPETPLQIKFITLEAGELPLETLMPIKEGFTALARLNDWLEEQEDSTEVTYQLATDEMIYFESTLFLPEADFDAEKELTAQLAELDVSQEGVKPLQALYSASLGASTLFKDRTTTTKESKPVEQAQEAPISAQPDAQQVAKKEAKKQSQRPKEELLPLMKKSGLSFFSKKPEKTKKKSHVPMNENDVEAPVEPTQETEKTRMPFAPKASEPKQKSSGVTVSQLVTGASVCLACLACVVTFSLQNELHQLERQTDKVETLQTLQLNGRITKGEAQEKAQQPAVDNKRSVAETKVAAFSQVFGQTYLTKAKDDKTYQKQVEPFMDAKNAKEGKNPDYESQQLRLWAIEEVGDHWHVSLLATAKDGGQTHLLTFDVKSSEGDHFKVHSPVTDHTVTLTEG